MGEGEIPIVLIPGWVSNVDLYEDPTTAYAGVAEQISRHARLIVWDKRGTGLSDPVSHVPPIDERMDDLRAVLDAADVDYPALFGISEGGPMSIMFAATYPDRVRSLVLAGTTVRFAQELPDFPWGFTPEQIAAGLEDIDDHWGEGALADLFFGPIADVPGVREMFGREQRACASPMMARMMWQARLRDRCPWSARQCPDADPGDGSQRGPHRVFRRRQGARRRYSERRIPGAAARRTLRQ